MAKKPNKNKKQGAGKKDKKLQVKLAVTPISGAGTSEKYQVKAGSTVTDLLAKVKVRFTKKDLFVGGKPATETTVLNDGDTIEVRERASGS